MNDQELIATLDGLLFPHESRKATNMDIYNLVIRLKQDSDAYKAFRVEAASTGLVPPPQLTEYNDVNNYKPCPSCGEPVYQDDPNNQAHPHCSMNCWFDKKKKQGKNPVTQIYNSGDLAQNLITLLFSPEDRLKVGHIDIYKQVEKNQFVLQKLIKEDLERAQLTEKPSTSPINQFAASLHKVINELETMLLEKNAAYGDSALNPARIFASCDPIELINVRIDDKLTRIKNRGDNDNEDAILDLMGYLILRRIATEKKATVTSVE